MTCDLYLKENCTPSSHLSYESNIIRNPLIILYNIMSLILISLNIPEEGFCSCLSLTGSPGSHLQGVNPPSVKVQGEADKVTVLCHHICRRKTHSEDQKPPGRSHPPWEQEAIWWQRICSAPSRALGESNSGWKYSSLLSSQKA